MKLLYFCKNVFNTKVKTNIFYNVTLVVSELTAVHEDITFDIINILSF